MADVLCSSHPHEELTSCPPLMDCSCYLGCASIHSNWRGSLEVLKLESTYKNVNRESCPFPHILTTIVALLFSSTFIYAPPPYTQCMYVHVPPCTSGGQRLTYWSWTMGSTLGLATNILNLVTTLPSLQVFISRCE